MSRGLDCHMQVLNFDRVAVFCVKHHAQLEPVFGSDHSTDLKIAYFRRCSWLWPKFVLESRFNFVFVQRFLSHKPHCDIWITHFMTQYTMFWSPFDGKQRKKYESLVPTVRFSFYCAFLPWLIENIWCLYEFSAMHTKCATKWRPKSKVLCVVAAIDQISLNPSPCACVCVVVCVCVCFFHKYMFRNQN